MNQTTVHTKFQRSFAWTLAGSLVYESIKASHCLALLACMPRELYGAMGSTFALVYLMTYVADLGATNSLPPFISMINKSRHNWATFILKYTLLPHLPILLACAAGATYFAAQKLSFLPALIIIPSLIILETMRSFMRMLLHATFLSKYVVIIELTILGAYLAAIWLPFLLLGWPISLNSIFIPHLLDSLICVSAFITLVTLYAKKLPHTELSLPQNLSHRLISTRLFNYLLRVTRNMFTSNFLTPFFAIRFGLASAGLFYIAGMLVNGLQAVIKSTIFYSGNALLANLKDTDHHSKVHAFKLISRRLLMLITPVIIIVGVNANTVIHLSSSHGAITQSAALALLFLFISFTEFFFILYEQFYVIEEASRRLFFFKILELVTLYGLVTSDYITTPVATLGGLVVIRLFGLLIIALDAWQHWRITVDLRSNRYLILASLAVAGIIAVIVHI